MNPIFTIKKPLDDKSPEEVYALGFKDGYRKAIVTGVGFLVAGIALVKFADSK